MEKILFVTGTDTAVGKTVVTGLLLEHLRSQGVHALAMKPFCSGGREDLRLLSALQDHECGFDEMCPYYFREPLAPWVAARREGRRIVMERVHETVERMAGRCERLIIEGVGGVMVPLGRDYFVRDLIAELRCEVVLVSANRLGTINHTLLTVQGLQGRAARRICVVLNTVEKADWSGRTNPQVIRSSLRPIRVIELPLLGRKAPDHEGIRHAAKNLKKTLARILG